MKTPLYFLASLFLFCGATPAQAANTTVGNGVTAFFWDKQILLSVSSPLASGGPSAGLYCPGMTPVGYPSAGNDANVVNYLVPATYAGMGCNVQVVSGSTYETHAFTMPDSGTATTADTYSNVAGYDIILVGGQSNGSNSGIGDRSDPLEGVVDDRIFQYTCDDANGDLILDNGETSEVVSAFDYVHDCAAGYGAAQAYVQQTGRLGFALSFARQYSMRNLTNNRKTLIVAGSVPGSGSPAWITGPTAYLPNLLSRAQAAMALPGKNRIVAFAWSQGEAEIGAVGDALNNGTYNQAQYSQYVDDYAGRILQIISTTRQTLGLPKLPFLISQHAPQWTAYQDIKLHFQDVDSWIASYSGYSAVVPSDGMVSNPTCAEVAAGTICEDAAHIHFSAQSHIDMGQRFFQTLQQVQAQP